MLPVKESCGGEPELATYFASAFDMTDDAEARVATAYIRMLDTLQEPSLGCGTQIDEGYRILWPPSELQPDGFFVRVAKTGPERELVSANLTMKGGRFQGTQSRTRTVTPEQWAALTNQMYGLDSQLQTIPPLKALDGGAPILDGHSWLFEERRDNRYRAIVVIPSRAQTFRPAARALVKVAELEMPGELVD
jgi:hypothetical protein